MLYEALEAGALKEMAAKGDGEAQFSQGWLLVSHADGNAGLLGAGLMGAGGRSPMADVGLALCTAQFPVADQTETRRCGHLLTICFNSLFAGANPIRRRARRF